jgi:DNA-binding NarL/FixJ family response regulator
VTIRPEQPQARIIVLTTYEGDVMARRALKAGATGYILKDLIRTELLDAVRAVCAGRRYMPHTTADRRL